MAWSHPYDTIRRVTACGWPVFVQAGRHTIQPTSSTLLHIQSVEKQPEPLAKLWVLENLTGRRHMTRFRI